MPTLLSPLMPIVKSEYLRFIHHLGFRTKWTFTYVHSHLAHSRPCIVVGKYTHFEQKTEILNSMYIAEFNLLSALCFGTDLKSTWVLLRAFKPLEITRIIINLSSTLTDIVSRYILWQYLVISRENKDDNIITYIFWSKKDKAGPLIGGGGP
jgi:hypothetical protein